MTLTLGVKPPEEIRAGEVLAYWEKLRNRTPFNCYAIYRSPNLDLWAWVDEERSAVALMWSVNTGHVHQADPRVLYALVSKLGGWI